MKKILILYILSFFVVTASGQSPTLTSDDALALARITPDKWALKQVPDFTIASDPSVTHSGAPSIKVVGLAKGKNFQPFSQEVPVNVKQVSRIKLSAYIKSEELEGETHVWCRILDKNRKQIGFQSSALANLTITHEGAWTKYAVPFTIDSGASYLLLGGFLKGTGQAWFDDFEIEYVPLSTEPAGEEALTFIRQFAKIVKSRSIYTDSLNWPVIENDIEKLAKGIKTVSDAGIVTSYVMDRLKRVGDNHSFIKSAVAARQYEKNNTIAKQPEGRLLSSGAGYISVPGFGSTNDSTMRAFAERIQQIIRTLDKDAGTQNWIVDLRNNTGGNMWPMVKGLAPLAGYGTTGYFITIDGGKESKQPWNVDRVQLADNYKLKRPDARIAVLIGPRTSSSGEMTTVGFIGRPNTRLFGQASGGFVTGNSSIPLSDGSMLLLATSYIADRNGNRHMKKITPDVIVNPGGGDEAVIKAAEKWLRD